MSARGVVLGVSEPEKEGRDWPPNIHVQNLMETRVLEVSKFREQVMDLGHKLSGQQGPSVALVSNPCLGRHASRAWPCPMLQVRLSVKSK